MKNLRKEFEDEKQYPSWKCNDTVIIEYIEWLEQKLEQPSKAEGKYCKYCGAPLTRKHKFWCKLQSTETEKGDSGEFMPDAIR